MTLRAKSWEPLSKRLSVIAFCANALIACGPPSDDLYKQCRAEGEQRASGHGLTAADIGELTEACMANHGFLLKKEGEDCPHNLKGQTDRLCYYRDTFLGRLTHGFTGH